VGPGVEVLEADFANRTYEIPYLLAVDHSKRAIVLALRGTLSSGDAFVDVHCVDQDIEYPVDAPTYVHAGMYKSALNVKQAIDRRGTFHSTVKDSRYKDYQLIVVGHSLGAGCASLLAILYKEEYPQLRCIAYSPPGGLMSYDAAVHCSAYVTSVMIGDDWISRLGQRSVVSLRNRIISALQQSRVPKYKLLCLCYDVSQPDEEHSALLPNDEDHVTLEIPQEYKQLYSPGRMIHLVRMRRQHYVAVYSDCTKNTEIIVSHRMMRHHLPNKVQKILSRTRAQGNRL